MLNRIPSFFREKCVVRVPMRRVSMACAVLLACMVAATAMAQDNSSPYAFHNNLMPEPAHLEVGQGHFVLQSGLTVTTDKFHNARLDNAIHRAMEQLKRETGVIVTTTPVQGVSSGAAFVVSVDGPGEAVQGVNENESYQLDVTSNGIHLHAATVVGAMWGLQTMLQLVQNDGKQYFFPAVSIQDQPRFPWRGLMIDCGRHFIPIPVIKRNIDAMAAVKLNVLHWHLSEDQGFRMQSKVFPLLTKDGSNGQFYTQAQAKEIIAYARARGIRVVPEFDMPGHTGSWLVGYPNLASAKGPFHIEDHFGIFDPVMDPTRDSTYQFIDKFIGEMVKIFPDAYFHIGGDEVNGVEWKNNPRIQAFMKAHNLKNAAALQAYFNARVLKILDKYHRHMIGWDEVLVPNLPKSVTIQSWRGYKSMAKAAREGHDAILSSGYYLDHMAPASKFYLVDPIPASSTLTPVERKRILGGEACIWTEYVNAKTIDARVWPRAAAIAERLWSPQSVDNVSDMYRRLNVESVRLEALGLTQISQEDSSLREMAGTQQIAPLQVLAETLEPASLQAIRDFADKNNDATTHAPLDHWVDALPPDPPFTRQFAKMVNDYLHLPANEKAQDAQLKRLFASWQYAEPGIMKLMAHSPLLAQAEPRPQQLAQLGQIGLAAMQYLSSGQPAPAGWKSNALAEIESAKTPVAATGFDVLKPLQQLVNAVQ